MQDLVESCLVLLIGCLALATVLAAFIGLIGLLGGRVERCAKCHRFSVSPDGHIHPDGCPQPHTLGSLPRVGKPNADLPNRTRHVRLAPLRHAWHH